MPESFWVKILKELPSYDEYFSGIITEDEYKQLEKDKTLEVSEEVSTYLIENEWAEGADKPEAPPVAEPERPEKPVDDSDIVTVKISNKLPKYKGIFNELMSKTEYSELKKGSTVELNPKMARMLIDNKWAVKAPSIVHPKENERLAKGFHVRSPISVNKNKLLPGNVLTAEEIEWLGKKLIKELLEKGLLKQVK